MLEIPLNANPEQIFSISINGQTYRLTVKLNSRIPQWNISFAVGGNDILNGVALTGGADMLSQYTIPIKNMFVVNLEDNLKDPTNGDLGTVSKLFILTDEEIENVTSV